MKNTTLSESENMFINSNQLNFHHCIKVGNALIVTSLLVVMSCILITFAFEQHFSLATQISAHISTIIFAATTKIGYVILCIGAHGLGHKAY